MHTIKEELNQIVAVLNQGKIALIPTDTICGLSCNALNIDAIDKIYSIKKRPLDKPLIVLIKNKDQLSKYLKKVPENLMRLIDESIEPTTFIVPNSNNILPSMLKSSEARIAFRIPKTGILKDLLELLNFPITSTSANINAGLTATRFDMVEDEILKKVDYIFPYKKFTKESQTKSKSSKIVLIKKDGGLKIIRP